MNRTSQNVADGIVRRRLLSIQHAAFCRTQDAANSRAQEDKHVSNFASLRRYYYQHHAATPTWRPIQSPGSDIVLHLPVIEWFASRCDHCTEFGVRDGFSTVALLAGCKGQVVSYDIEHSRIVDQLRAMELPCPWDFRLGDTGDANLEVGETDFLFIDTLHTYDHVTKELTLFGRKARRYIGFHDTETCGYKDESGPNPEARGILAAIVEFLARYQGEYETVYKTNANNGLWILEKKQ